MLHLIPVELLALVVRSTLPDGPYTPLNYRERQDGLARLCLVSRVVREVAQPVLFEVVELTSEAQKVRFLETVSERRDLGVVVRRMRFGDPTTGKDLDRQDQDEADMLSLSGRLFDKLSVSCPGVVEIRVDQYKGSLMPSWLHEVTSLRRLILADTVFMAVPFRLPHLEELSASYTWMQEEIRGDIVNTATSLLTQLTPASVPALRAVHLEGGVSFSRYYRTSIAPLSAIPPQITALSIGLCRNENERPIELLPSAPFDRILPTLNLAHSLAHQWTPGLALATSVRLQYHAFCPPTSRNTWTQTADTAKKGADELHYFVSQLLRNDARGARRALRTLYLPDSLGLAAPMTVHLRASVFALHAGCRARGVEVVYEPPVHWRADSLVSREFMRRCVAEKERKEREAVEEEGNGTAV
ncbi:hypothetical protein JCM6882_007435 [Rhodosporidiobolus microsporus]